jgi:hypothetical protein
MERLFLALRGVEHAAADDEVLLVRVDPLAPSCPSSTIRIRRLMAPPSRS